MNSNLKKLALGLAASAWVGVAAAAASAPTVASASGHAPATARIASAQIRAARAAARKAAGGSAQQAALAPAAARLNPHQAGFAWAAASTQPQWFGPLKMGAQIEAQARDFLGHEGAALGVTPLGLAEARVVEAKDGGRGGPSVARFQQRVNGLEVFRQTVNVLLDKTGKPVAASGSFVPVRSKLAVAAAALTEPQAIVAALNNLGIAVGSAQFNLVETRGNYRHYAASVALPAFRFAKAPRVKSLLYKSAKGLIPAFQLEIEGTPRFGQRIGYIMVVSAIDGSVLFKKNMVAEAAYSYRVFANAADPFQFQPYDSPLGNGFAPFTGAPGDDKARTPVPSVLVTIDSLLGASDPWLAAGATGTNGNNVNAYIDSGQPDGYNAPPAGVPDSATVDLQPGTTGANSFDYPAGTDADPSSSNGRASAAINLFYVNNWLHDFWYQAGFDEASGNAQADNYGRGGAAADPILGEGQDNSGRNNANMATPGDGSSPTMQMYLFDGALKGEICVRPGNAALANCPSDNVLNTGYEFAGAGFGPQTFNISANAVLINDNTGASFTDACSENADPATGKDVTPVNPTEPARLNGMVALIDRGTCAFTAKATYAMANNAAAMVVCQRDDGPPSTMGNADIPDPTGQVPPTEYTIPSVMISKASCNAIKAELAANRAVPMHLLRLASIDRDGTFDNLIIAHEYYHYVSNRLVNDGAGLNNQQGGGMGEGWGDFSSLMLAVREDDQLVPGNDRYQSAYSSGVYVDTSYYFGIRRQPYSTDFAKNSLSLRHIQDGTPLDDQPARFAPTSFGVDGASNSEVHNTGEVWTEMLWQCYAGILNTPGNGSFTEKRARMASYVVTGLKMTPSDPTFTQARDGVWAAAYATNYADYAACARGFATRGAGVYAVAPPSASTDNVGVTEDGIALVSRFALTRAEFIPANACDTDAVLDSGEAGELELSFRNDGTYVPTAPFSATVKAVRGAGAGVVSFGSGGAFTLPALGIGESATVRVPVSAGSFASSPEVYGLAVKFGAVAGGDPQVQEPEAAVRSVFFNHDGGITRTGDDMEAPLTSAVDWDSTSTQPAAAAWQLDDGTLSGFTGSTGANWFVPDPGAPSDAALVTPAFAVPAAGSFSMAFTHQYAFESDLTGIPPFPFPFPFPFPVTYYDGGVIEVSVNGGPWQDVVDFGASFGAGSGYNQPISALADRQGFGGANGAFTAATLDFGSLLAGKSARIRFRAVSDNTGAATGWAVDNVVLTGIARPVFTSVLAENGVCVNQPPLVIALADFNAAEHPANNDVRFPMVGLSATASDKETAASALVVQWTQTAGPTVMIIGASTLTPSFTTPRVSSSTPLTFVVTVTDAGGLMSSDTVVVTISNVNQLPIANAGSDGAADEGALVRLDGSGSSDSDGPADPDGVLSYAWVQLSGPIVTLVKANTARPEFTAPHIEAATPLVLALTTSNRDGSSSRDEVTVTVADVPVPPTPPRARETGRFGGGAFYAPGLLLLLALRRRRRLH